MQQSLFCLNTVVAKEVYQYANNELNPLPCRGMYKTYDSECVARKPQKAKNPAEDIGFFDVDYKSCLKNFDYETDGEEKTCVWYWCASKDGCRAPSFNLDPRYATFVYHITFTTSFFVHI